MTLPIMTAYNQNRLRWARRVDRFMSLLAGPMVERILPPFNEVTKILVIQSHLIGDVVMATPLLRALRRSFPNAEITLFANPFAMELLNGSSYIDKIITARFPWATYDFSISNIKRFVVAIRMLRSERFDLAFDAQIDLRNLFIMRLVAANHRIGHDVTGGKWLLTAIPKFPEDISSLLRARLSIVSVFDLDITDIRTELPVSDLSLACAGNFLMNNAIDRSLLIGVHPGASVPEKRWPAGRFAKVIDWLRQAGYHPVLISGPDDGQVISAIQSAFSTTIPVFAASLSNLVGFISLCKLLICLDSAAVHIAGAVGTPAVAIYGPKEPSLTLPEVPWVSACWSGDLSCRPCRYGNCTMPNENCMDAVSVDEVIDAINTKLQETGQERVNDVELLT